MGKTQLFRIQKSRLCAAHLNSKKRAKQRRRHLPFPLRYSYSIGVGQCIRSNHFFFFLSTCLLITTVRVPYPRQSPFKNVFLTSFHNLLMQVNNYEQQVTMFYCTLNYYSQNIYLLLYSVCTMYMPVLPESRTAVSCSTVTSRFRRPSFFTRAKRRK